MTKQFFPLLVALFMLLGGVQPVSALNVPEDVLEYNGDLFGLIDDTGREIIAPSTRALNTNATVCL